MSRARAAVADPAEDADLAQAVDDILETVLALRQATVAATTAPPLQRHQAEAYVRELADLVASRASSVHVTTDTLLTLANERIACDRRLPRDGAARTAARRILDLAREASAAHKDAIAAREQLATARGIAGAAERHERATLAAFHEAAGIAGIAGLEAGR